MHIDGHSDRQNTRFSLDACAKTSNFIGQIGRRDAFCRDEIGPNPRRRVPEENCWKPLGFDVIWARVKSGSSKTDRFFNVELKRCLKTHVFFNVYSIGNVKMTISSRRNAGFRSIFLVDATYRFHAKLSVLHERYPKNLVGERTTILHT